MRRPFQTLLANLIRVQVRNSNVSQIEQLAIVDEWGLNVSKCVTGEPDPCLWHKHENGALKKVNDKILVRHMEDASFHLDAFIRFHVTSGSGVRVRMRLNYDGSFVGETILPGPGGRDFNLTEPSFYGINVALPSHLVPTTVGLHTFIADFDAAIWQNGAWGSWSNQATLEGVAETLPNANGTSGNLTSIKAPMRARAGDEVPTQAMFKNTGPSRLTVEVKMVIRPVGSNSSVQSLGILNQLVVGNTGTLSSTHAYSGTELENITIDAFDSFGNLLDRKTFTIEDGDMGPSEERLGESSPPPIEDVPPVVEQPVPEPSPTPTPLPRKGLLGFGFLPFDPIVDVPNLLKKRR